MKFYKNVNIICHSWLSKFEINELLVNFDIYCVPSLIEAFGQSNIEAMYMKVPTVILPTNVQLLLHNSEYCWIPNGCNPIALKDTIVEIINSSILIRERKGNLANSIVGEKYSHSSTMKEFNILLNRIANG